MNADETKRYKARQLRYKKPIAKNLNLQAIQDDLWDIQEECEDVRWYTDSEDGTDSLINALDGDEDEAYEFKMAFADLCAECDRMREDLHDVWLPECFDIFFAAVTDTSDLLGWDSYEGDYFGISWMEQEWGQGEAERKLLKMSKKDLIAAARQCLRIYQAYIGLRNRYDSLKAAIDILKDQNTGYLQTVKEIERLYEEVVEDQWSREEDTEQTREWERYTKFLPPEAWLQ